MSNGSTLGQLFSLDGRKALITGAGGGIGHALARGLAGVGAAVTVHARTMDKIEALRDEIVAGGGAASAITAELSTVADARRLVAETHDALGGLDILINCAATNTREQIAEVTEEHWDRIMSVNLKSLYFLSQEAYRLMKPQRSGKIIHIGSITPFFALGGVSVYGAAKGGVTQLTKAMAVEWAKDNIQVNCVVPGYISTPLSKPIWTDPYKAEWLRSRIPLRRPAEPEELVGAIVLLAAPASSYITGTTVVVDGGALAGGWWEPDEVLERM